MEDGDRGRGEAGSVMLARKGRRREPMPGEFFTVLFSKNILTNLFFVAFQCRKAKDGDNNVEGGRSRRGGQ